MIRKQTIANALILSATIAASSASFARRGGSDERTDRPARGTAAWFIAESAEHELRGLLAAGTLGTGSLTKAEVALTSASTSTVAFTAGGSLATDDCRMVDEWSRSNTVLKKEVYCDGVGNAERVEAPRGSQAWAVVEGLEHALRLAFLADAKVAASATGASSELLNATQVQVFIGLASGAELSYLCTQQRSGLSASLNCSAN